MSNFETPVLSSFLNILGSLDFVSLGQPYVAGTASEALPVDPLDMEYLGAPFCNYCVGA